jgi:uncharacterized membrane protein HdeD (DUF308 family)
LIQYAIKKKPGFGRSAFVMVAPEDDFPARPRQRLDRVLAFFTRPRQPASELLRDRRLSLALRTAAAFLFGTAFLWPEVSDAATIRLFAAYTFIDGILAISPGGWGTAFRLGWPLLVGGVIDLAGSGIAYVWPHMTLPLLSDVAAVWAIASAFAFLAAYTTLRRSDRGQLFLLCAIASMILGRALVSQVPFDAIILSTWFGIYAMTMWVLMLKLTLKQYSTLWL